MQGNKNNQKWRKNLWLQILGIFALTLLLLAFMYFLEKLIDSPAAPPIGSLAGEITLDIFVITLSFMVTKRFRGGWKFFFVALAIENIFRIGIAIQLIALYFQPNIAAHNEWILPNHIVHALLYLSRPTYWAVFLVLALRISKGVKLKMRVPSLITVLAILLAMSEMIRSFYFSYAQHDFSIWSITKSSYDLLLFSLLIYVLPIAKNNAITLLVESFILLVIGDILATKSSFTVTQYFTHIQYAHIFWVSGKCMAIYCLMQLLKKENQDTSTWFYRLDCTHPQIVYWGNSIAAMLFFLTGISYFLFPYYNKTMHDIFHINTIIFGNYSPHNSTFPDSAI